MTKKYEIYNDDNLLVANDIETLLELIDMSGYRVEFIEEEESEEKNGCNE